MLYSPSSTEEEGHSTGRVTFYPNGTGDPPLLMMQTADLIFSCSNLPSDWTNIYFLQK